MGKPTGFKEFTRELPGKKTVEERLQDYKEFIKSFPEEKLINQAARCMDCGIPFCHSGCPLGNLIPDWNDMVYRENWAEAARRLHATNNFPEFTGRICPAPCEEACVLGINEPPVTIENIEYSIIEYAFDHGMILPQPPKQRTGRKVAVIGSGPAGLAAAQQLNRAGHNVTVYERSDKIGGLLRYGIPDFKLEKWIVDRRINQMTKEGVVFETGVHVGVNFSVERLEVFDAIVLAGGSTIPRDLSIPGREMNGIHFAMDFLTQQNRKNSGLDLGETQIKAKNKRVIVIGGGDTGSDCVGTANRQGAKSVLNFELFSKPSPDRPANQPWPYFPVRLKNTSSHEEGCQREWSIMTKEFIGNHGKLEKLKTVSVAFDPKKGMVEVPGSEKEWPVDLVLLALGFLGPAKEGMIAQLEIELDERGNVKSNAQYRTSKEKIFTTGDMRRGQSLVVWAISEGREVAYHVDQFLMGSSLLPRKGDVDLPRI